MQVLIANQEKLPALMGLSGLLRSAALENPKIKGQVIALEAAFGADDEDVAAIIAKIEYNRRFIHQTVVRYNDKGERLVAGFSALNGTSSQVPVVANPAEPLPFKHNGVYWITGGMGGLGRIFANEIAHQVAAKGGANVRLVLTGRSTLGLQQQLVLEQLNALGVSAYYHTVDMQDMASLSELVEYIAEHYGKLTAVIHSAGIIKDNFAINKSEQEFAQVLAPKVAGLCNLDKVTSALDLDFLVLFSSVAATLGNVGQTDYSAGNGFMDAFAHQHNRPNRRVLSINWPLWKDGGMQVDASTEQALACEFGIVPLATDVGLGVFYQALASNEPQVMVLAGEGKKIAQWVPGLEPAHTPAPAPTPTSAPAPVPVKSGASDLKGAVKHYIKGKFSQVLGVDHDTIKDNTSFNRYGLDSIMALDLIRLLEKDLGSVSKTLFFEYDSVDTLGEYLIAEYPQKLAQTLQLQAKAPAKTQAPPVKTQAKATDTYQLIAKDSASAEQLSVIRRIKGNDHQDGALLEMWPLWFVSHEQAFCHCLIDGQLLFATAFCGVDHAIDNNKAQHHEITLLGQLIDYCQQQGYQLGYLDLSSQRKLALEQRYGWLSTPVGVVQGIEKVQDFTLEGQSMRKLRSAINRFTKQGHCYTKESYHLSSDDHLHIKAVILAWSEHKQVVNNVATTLSDIDNGNLWQRYRVFLTYVDDTLHNVILIRPIKGGYLMDQEYYLPHFASGGTEFATVSIIEKLAQEHGDCEFSFGLTWGIYEPQQGYSDEQGWQLICQANGLLAQLFKSGGQNYQYKNKFRGTVRPVYLYRDKSTSTQLIVHCLSQFFKQGVSFEQLEPMVTPQDNTLTDECFDVSKLAASDIKLDLVSDSWPYLDYEFIQTRMRKLMGE